MSAKLPTDRDLQLPERYLFAPHANVSGGVVSAVVDGEFRDQTTGKVWPAVLKCTTAEVVEAPHFSHADAALIEHAPATHALDIALLERLQGNPDVQVPSVLWADPDQRATIMVDFRAEGYTLMADLLVNGNLPLSSASVLGHALGRLHHQLDRFSDVQPVENAQVQMRERLEETHVLLRGSLAEYSAIEQHVLSGGSALTWTDGHPKNIAVYTDQQGSVKVMLFDFGRLLRGVNRQYPAPNFAAHVGVAMLSGVLPYEFGVHYIEDFVTAYSREIPVAEEWFVKYFAAEMVHRGLAGRWIDMRMLGKEPRELGVRCHALFNEIIFGSKNTEKVTTIEGLFLAINNICK